MPITNNPKKHDEHTDHLRAAIEHRATWMYLLMDEARKKGLDWDDFARKAIFKCGQFHGNTKFTQTDDLRQLAGEFTVDTYKKVFDMEIVELTDERFIVEFNYCPLVNGWLKQTDNEEEIDTLCDIAMDGDRGVVDTFPAFDFDLQGTIAGGEKVCHLVFSRKPQ